MTEALIGFAVLLVLIIIVRIPIAFSMGIGGFAVLQALSLDNIPNGNQNAGFKR